MLDEAMRYRLHGRLEEVLGGEEANALMAELSAPDWSELATKSDLAVMGSDLRAEMHKTITAQTRQLFFALIAANTAFGGLMIAAVRIH